MKVGVLHPGAMGASVVQALTANGHEVFWSQVSRSNETRTRALAAGAKSCASLAELCDLCEVIVSVCPPESATELAEEVAAQQFTGLFADVNAISPVRVLQISKQFPDSYVDGGIIGPPALKPGTTRLYLSGSRASEVHQLFGESVLEPVILTGALTAASALKMCYASWTKGSAALLLNTRALAEALDIGDSLEAEWERSQAGTLARARATVAGTAPKAWRFSGEMEEIANTFAAAGLPDGFHQGAADFYERLAEFKDQSGVSLADMFELLANPHPSD